MKAALLVLVGCAAPAATTAMTAPSPSHAHYATVNGLRMYYEDHGAGRPLVLLHGGGSTAQTSFGAIIPALAGTHRLIAPEQQAHGHTGDIDRPLTFEQMADDTAQLLDQLGVTEADILGFSSGSVVAMQLAIRHPRLVHRLVLCSSFFARDGLPAALWQSFDHASPADMPLVLREAFVAAAPRREDVPAMFARQVSVMRAFVDIPEATLHAITAPALVLVGDGDVMPPEHAAKLARLLGHGELAVMPGSGHGTYLGAAEGQKPGSPLPAIATAMIEAFLAGRL